MMHQRGKLLRLSFAAQFAALFAGVLIGCGSEKKGDGSGEDDQVTVKKVPADKLPPLLDYLPPLDDGKVELAGPEGWKPLPREIKYLARFVKGDTLGLPRIIVTVDPSDYDEVDMVSEGNVVEFADLVAKRLKEKKSAVLESPKPMLIGKNAYTRYVLRAKFRDSNIERQMLQTVVGGRLYTIDLQVEDGKLLPHRDAAYAVAAGIKFAAAKTDAAPADSPAEKTPAD